MTKLKGKLLTIAAVVGLLLALPAVAAADSTVEYEAGGFVLYAGPVQALPVIAPGLVPIVTAVLGPPLPDTDTEADFELRDDGSIKEVEVNTTDELVAGSFGSATCDPADPFCPALVGSFPVSRHDSTVIVDEVVLLTPTTGATPADPLGSPIPVPTPDLAIFLVGEIEGELESAFSVLNLAPAPGLMAGTAKLGIEGEAVYACILDLADLFTPTAYIPISFCVDGPGKLAHPLLDVVDSGRFEVDTFTGVFGDLTENEGNLTVTVDVIAVPPVLSLAVTEGEFKTDSDDDD